jgi:hypothetical protein
MEEKGWRLADGQDCPRPIWPCTFTLEAKPVLSPDREWAPPRQHPDGELHEMGLFRGGDIIGTNISPRSWDLYAHQIHAECLLQHQECIPKSVREYELIFPGIMWRDNSNFPNGLRGQYTGYLCSPMLRWHWHDNEWWLEWYWYSDGTRAHQLAVEIPKRWHAQEYLVGP